MNVLDRDWPVNYVEQKEYMRLLEKEMNKLKKRTTQVVITSTDEPTQQEWDDAFFEQSGFPAPIPEGTRCLWRSANSGRFHLYTVINDLEGGEGSSGTVIPYQKEDNRRPPFRLLGTFKNGRLYNVYDNISFELGQQPSELAADPAFYLLMDYDRLAKLNLSSLLIYFKLRTSLGIAADPQLSFWVGQIGKTNWVDSGFYSSAVDTHGSTWAVFTNAATAFSESTARYTGAGNRSLEVLPVDELANSDSLANTYTEGIMFINNVVWNKDKTVVDNQPNILPISGTSGIVFGSIIRAALTTGLIKQFVSTFQKYDYSPLKNSLFPIGLTTTGGNEGTFTDKGASGVNAWIYGMYSKEGTPMDIGEFK